MKVADFFCGAGGFSEGFRQAGFEISFALDIWTPAINTFRANKPGAKVVAMNIIELAELEDSEFHTIIPDTEIIIGSPPCVAFSSSNKSGNGDKGLGLELVKSYLKIIARKKFKENSRLRYWILENVPNSERYIQDSYTSKELGLPGDLVLHVKNSNSKVYNAKYFSVPSSRSRYICGDFPKPIQTNNDDDVITLQEVLSNLHDPKASDTSVIINDINYPTLSMPIHSISDHHYLSIVEDYDWKIARQLKVDHGYMGKMSFPERLDKPARTIMATMSARSRESMILGYKKGQYRLPTVREIASLMSFPIDYRFYGSSISTKYRLVDNAVPPKMSFAFAKAICKAEALEIPKVYKRIVHDQNISFHNLNNLEILRISEKQKRIDAKFRQHIPNLKIKSFRIELNNYQSDFQRNNLIWSLILHYGQGKERARKLFFDAMIMELDEKYDKEIHLFIQKISKKLCSFNELQKRYCMTASDRGSLLGPSELLEMIGNYVADMKLVEESISILYQEKPVKIPFKIVFAFNLLQNILLKMRGYSDGCSD